MQPAPGLSSLPKSLYLEPQQPYDGGMARTFFSPKDTEAAGGTGNWPKVMGSRL